MKLTNPFKNAKVVSANYPVADYIREDFKRGDPAYVMSRGSLMKFAECPSKWIEGVKDDETKSTDWGNLVDCLALTPSQFRYRYAVSPAQYDKKVMECPTCGSQTEAAKCNKCKAERVPKVIKKEWDLKADICSDWKAEKQKVGLTVVGSSEVAQAGIAVSKLLKDQQIQDVIDCSEVQVYCTADYHDTWHDNSTGLIIPVKILIDLLPENKSAYANSIADLKTTESAVPRLWAKSAFKYTYDVQAALQMDIFNLASGEQREAFRHIIQESFPPYQVGRRLASEEFLDLGRLRYKNALALYCQCLASGIWPDYDSHCPSRNQYKGWQYTNPEDWMVASVPDVPTLVEKQTEPEEHPFDLSN